ncbi:hypothetical protein Hanom_Chr12g01160501 [Helianthus anomalus]
MGSDLTGIWPDLVGMLTVVKSIVYTTPLSLKRSLFRRFGSLTRRNQVEQPTVAVVSYHSITILSPRLSFYLKTSTYLSLSHPSLGFVCKCKMTGRRMV